MKKIDWFILALIIVVIIAIAIWNYKSSPLTEKNQSRLDAFRMRLTELEKQIEAEISSLKLTKEMKEFLELKIGRVILTVKMFLGVLFIIIFSLLALSGHDWLSALLATSGILSILIACISGLILNRIPDVNELIKAGHSRIRDWIYKKYAYDPYMMPALELSIEIKQREANEIRGVLKGT